MPVPRVLAIALALATTSAQAQGVDQWGKGVEQSAHQSLLDMLERTNPPLAPFATDGCSGGLSQAWTLVADRFPDFEQAHDELPPWEQCCVVHDHAYHNAGEAKTAEQGYETRLAADRDLRSCVIDTGVRRGPELSIIYGATPKQINAAYDTIAQAMYLAVRFGGGPCTGLSWRWGYGYPNCFASLPDEQ